MQLSEFQRGLVTGHLDLVDRVIRNNIQINNRVLQSYDDFYQVGCEALCKAAIQYKPSIGEFAPLAKAVVKNALLDYCRAQNIRSRSVADIPLCEYEDESYTIWKELRYEDDTLEMLYSEQLDCILAQLSSRYSGVTQKGVEALRMRAMGATSSEIAALFGTTINNVNAWISKARHKLKKEPELLCLLI